jgi:hypothetical protein
MKVLRRAIKIALSRAVFTASQRTMGNCDTPGPRSRYPGVLDVAEVGALAGQVTLQSLDQAGVDQQSIEAAGFRPALAGVEHALASQHDLLLLLERWI